MEERYALLIDAENVSAKYIKPILDELSKYGNVTYKRIYGDWTKSQSASWKEVLLQNSITPIQQFSYTYGKNATDSAMIIDAMDMLYTNDLEGFCLVSSDSDFTKLASRLRESGRTVIGMGESKTPTPFRKACDIFTELELLLDDIKDGKKNEVTKGQIEESVIKIITENQNNDKETGLGEVGSRLVKLYPDFDVRRYGYSLLSKFLETFPKLKLKQDGTQVTVMLYEDKSKKEMLEEFIVQQIKDSGVQGILLGTLGNRIHNKFKDFKVRDYGYSQFKQYVQSLHNVEVEEEDERYWAVYKNVRLE
ncbi:NYN domain-containing protein [Firmicutes bacterium OM07-11]|nr:NYN domain-containing protein [Firmicutes bacterium OM07-11]